ncbi:MAG: hypothetical protein RSB55_10565 [Oscillospiraceae bacterium]
MSMPVIVPGTTTTTQAINDIIESVALEETGLSHILNAEGEKIQKMLAIPGVTADQLLAVNASVQATVDAVTKLNMVLQSKLALFSGQITA